MKFYLIINLKRPIFKINNMQIISRLSFKFHLSFKEDSVIIINLFILILLIIKLFNHLRLLL